MNKPPVIARENYYILPPNDKSVHLVSKDFYANKDNFNVVTNWFSQRFRARYIRIVPLEWNNAICLRAELYGCDNGKPDYAHIRLS